VIVLTDKSFDSVVTPQDLMLVEFYAPWCGHCKQLAPEYAKAATVLKKEGIPLAKVDATEQTSVASKYGVSSYPTLKLFRNGVASDYGGPRQKDGIVEYMRKQVGPSSRELTSVEEAQSILEREEVIIAGFFVSKADKDAKTFANIANTLRDTFKFARSYSEEVISHYGYRSAIVMFKPYDERKVIYAGAVTQPDVTDWLYKVNLPLAGPITKSNLELYQKKGSPLLKVYIDVDMKANKKQMDYYLNRLRKAAKDFPAISFGIADKKTFTEDRERFALTGTEAHQMVIEDFAAQEKYKFKSGDKFSAELVKEFSQEYITKSIKPYIKSEAVPEPSKPGEVAVVVGETFKDLVLDDTKDVMIELYAPWCGHCKALTPKYEELAKEFKDSDSVVIAKMDATANDAPHAAYKAGGYPTILFAPAGNKDAPVKYDGEREVAAMKKFIMQKASTIKKSKKKAEKKI
jgi:protein disulfide isomerase